MPVWRWLCLVVGPVLPQLLLHSVSFGGPSGSDEFGDNGPSAQGSQVPASPGPGHTAFAFRPPTHLITRMHDRSGRETARLAQPLSGTAQALAGNIDIRDPIQALGAHRALQPYHANSSDRRTLPRDCQAPGERRQRQLSLGHPQPNTLHDNEDLSGAPAKPIIHCHDAPVRLLPHLQNYQQ